MNPVRDAAFDIDPTPRRADGEFMAHAKITTPAVNGEHAQIIMSGDLAPFDERKDAIAYAQAWAREWISAYLRKGTTAEP